MDRSLARLRPQNGAMTNSSFMTDTLQVIYLPLDPSILSTLFAYLLRSIYFFNFDISLLLVIVEAELGLKNVKKQDWKCFSDLRPRFVFFCRTILIQFNYGSVIPKIKHKCRNILEFFSHEPKNAAKIMSEQEKGQHKSRLVRLSRLSRLARLFKANQ